MKRIIVTLTILIIFVACSSKKDNASVNNEMINTIDTAGLAEYQAWRQQKDQLQPIDMNGLESDIAEPQKNYKVTEDPKPGTVTKIIYRDRIAKRKSTTQLPEPINETYTYPKPQGPTRESVSRSDAQVGEVNGTGETKGSTDGASDGNVVVQTPTEPVAKKEGWSKAAKGAAIGTASGAVIGAVISKNKGLGAVIGGVAGGLGGYAIGRSKDKKDGRYLVEN